MWVGKVRRRLCAPRNLLVLRIVGSGWSLHGENNLTQSLRDALLFPALLTLNR